MSKPPTHTLPCKQCGYVNEPERVYCHNCGAKLDRSVLPKEEDLRKGSPDKERRRIQRMANPDASSVKRELKALVKVLVGAAICAMVIQAARPPEGAPPERSNELARLISSDLADAVESPTPRQLVFTEADVNGYMRQSIREGKSDNWLSSIVQFKRAYVNFRPGVCVVGMQKQLWGFPIYFGSAYKLQVQNNRFAAENVGGNIGRLAIHPLLMQGGDYIFGSLWTALKRDYERMQQLQSVSVEKGRIVMVTRGRTAAR